MSIHIGINGFGRIGRNAFKVIEQKYKDELEVVAINDLTEPRALAHLLKYDSLYGRFDGEVVGAEDFILVNGRTIAVTAKKNPAELDWRSLNVDIVLECTGHFAKRDAAIKHIEAGAKKVIISALAGGADATIVLGVNEEIYRPDGHAILSNASCTTNAVTPVLKVLMDNFGIKKGFMTTVHSYTNDQRILDLPHDDLRRARAAALSIIPTKTGADKAISAVLPALTGKMNGLSLRVPTPTVSIIDLSVETEKETDAAAVNAALREASEKTMKGILDYCAEPLVSVDFRMNPASAIIDALSTAVVGGNLIKVAAWYDNEWGYSNRLADLAAYAAKRI